MLNKILSFIRQERLVAPGDTVVCAVSGGADSVAMLFAFYLLKSRLKINLEAAHFNHCLRGEESDADEAFVREFCAGYQIPLHCGAGQIVPGKKGLEAAAREARYGFLRSIPGKIATAHTADDNAETVLLHLIRGTGLKGLGGIAPISGNVIRPMLTVTRQEVEAFLDTYHLPHREDSTNGEDAFLRNRVRHDIMPLLRRENPRIGENLSQMARNLRVDAEYLEACLKPEMPDILELRQLHPAIRSRYLERFLKENGVPEPEQRHISGLQDLVFSQKPSASMQLPGGVTLARSYHRLVRLEKGAGIQTRILPCPGQVDIPEAGVRVTATQSREKQPGCFWAQPVGTVEVRARAPEDRIKTPGGTKTLKKWMIDAKIPAARRSLIPVIADEQGILGVYGLGGNLNRQDKTGYVFYFTQL